MTFDEVLGPAGRELAVAAFGFCDRHWDDERGLVRAPTGSGLGRRNDEDVHLVRESAWYAYGLLLRGRHDQAVRCLEAVLDLQYDEPGTGWHGTFARFAEIPVPGTGAVMWRDFDPNWRQFVGTILALMVRDFGPVVDVDRALALAIEGEPTDRIPARYSNIALMKAWLDVEVGDRQRGEALAEEIATLFFDTGGFDEYNSPTYYGIDLYALALWATRSSSPRLRQLGARLEAALWRDIARWYHPGLRNLCGPYSRTYGMDMTGYVATLGFSVADHVGLDRAPLPKLTDHVDHGHDLFLAPIVAALGSRMPADVDLKNFGGDRSPRTEFGRGRVATGWLGERLMVGAETNSGDPVSSRSQYAPATAHWFRPDGSIGWLRAMMDGPQTGHAGRARLEFEWPSNVDDPELTVVVCSPGEGVEDVQTDDWTLAGVAVRVDRFGVDRATVTRSGDHLTIVYRSTGTGDRGRLTLRFEVD